MARIGNFLAAAAVSMLTPFAALAAAVLPAGFVSPNVIFGSGNVNGSFTIGGDSDIEIGLRAKLRYDNTSACTGSFGCAQNTFNYDGDDTYTFVSADSNAPTNRSVFNFEWSIHTLGGALNDFHYMMIVDTDPTVNDSGSIAYDPLGAISTGYYLGTDASGNGGAPFNLPGTGDLSLFTVAQNSVNMGFIGAPVTPGQFSLTLAVFDGAWTLKTSTSIQVIVDAPAPIPLPAGGVLLIGAFGALAALRRRRAKAA